METLGFKYLRTLTVDRTAISERPESQSTVANHIVKVCDGLYFTIKAELNSLPKPRQNAAMEISAAQFQDFDEIQALADEIIAENFSKNEEQNLSTVEDLPDNNNQEKPQLFKSYDVKFVRFRYFFRFYS